MNFRRCLFVCIWNLLAMIAVATLLGACGGGSTTASSGSVTTPSSGSIAGTAKNSVVFLTLNSAPSASCPNGGITVESGVDTNGNGVLDPSEVSNTQYVCNGTNGTNGTNGAKGASGSGGLNALVAVATEAPGANCAAGGEKVSAGLDTNGNGILDSSEVTSSTYICNGATGATGPAGATGERERPGQPAQRGRPEQRGQPEQPVLMGLTRSSPLFPNRQERTARTAASRLPPASTPIATACLIRVKSPSQPTFATAPWERLEQPGPPGLELPGWTSSPHQCRPYRTQDIWRTTPPRSRSRYQARPP